MFKHCGSNQLHGIQAAAASAAIVPRPTSSSNRLVVQACGSSSAGEVDIDTSDLLRAAIDIAVLRRHVRMVTLDLNGVTFMDSSGVGVIAQARRAARERGVRIRIVGAQGMVRTVLELR
jgi:anti-anti-sigma factor